MALGTPVVMIIFNRPDLTRRVLRQVAKARPRRLMVIADGPRSPEEDRICLETRQLMEDVNWDCEVLTNYVDFNMGCRDRVASGLNWVFSLVEEAIVLEDDCLPAQSFFPFCQNLLEHYRDDRRIMHISGDNFQSCKPTSPASYYFSRYTHVWGWASWSRAWKHYDVAMRTWPQFKQSGMLEALCEDPFEQSHWTALFDQTHAGLINTWDYQWLYACWTQNALSILPCSNLVSNIGFREDATHTRGTSQVANLAVQEIRDLQHPAFVVADRRADQFTFDHIFGGKKMRQGSTLKARIRSTLARAKHLFTKKV